MKKITSTKDWKEILDYLINVESFAKLKEMRSSIFEHRETKEPLSSEAMLAKKDIAHSESLSDKELLAISVFDLIGGQAEKLEDGRIAFFGFEIQPDLLFDVKFNDSIKMVDFMATEAFPSQIEHFDRTEGYPSVVVAAREGKIRLSDPNISLIHNDGQWKISGVESPSEDLLSSIRNLNNVFYDSVDKIMDRKIEQYNELTMN